MATETELQGLMKLLGELTTQGIGVDEAIAIAELQLKQLRALKSTLGIGTKPKPRATKKAGAA